MMEFSESGHVFRATSRLSRGTLKSKGGGKLSIHFCATGDTIETVFRTNTSVNQLSIYRAVSDLCDEYSACQNRTTCFGKTIWPIVCVKCDEDTHIWPMILRKKKMCCQDVRNELKVITTKSCNWILYCCRIPDNSWGRTILHDERHCRILTINRVSALSWVHFAKRLKINWWIRGNTKIGSVLKVTPSCLQGKKGVEIRIESTNKDSSHSWVRISHGLNKLVTNLNNKGEDARNLWDAALKTNALAFAIRSRLKQNHEDVLLPAHLRELYLSVWEFGPILSQKIARPSIIQCRSNWALFFVMVIYLEKTMERLNSGD